MIVPLAMKPPESSEFYLDVGEYNYPFQIQLPFNLPTSFQHNYGKIGYMLSATIDIPWSFDKHATRHFTVISHMDLNSYPALQMPARISEAKSMSGIFTRREPMNVEFGLTKGGFVCGERLSFSATIDNKSEKEICSRIVVLVQKMRFHATNKSVQFERTVASAVNYNGKVAAQSVDTWSDASLVIPPLCPSSNPATCRIIEVVYELQFRYRHTGLFSNNFTTSLPLVIGTIPLREDTNDQPPPYTFEMNYFSKEDTAQAHSGTEYKPNEEVFNSNNPMDLNACYPYYAPFGALKENNEKNF
jgi:hypothetical protein